MCHICRRCGRSAHGRANHSLVLLESRPPARDDREDRHSSMYWDSIATHDSYNWDGGSAQRLSNGRILVAFTSPYNQRAFNANYSMMAWEVAPSGGVLSRVTVPHSLGQLTTQGGYRMIPWASVGGETSEAPGWCEDCETAER